MQTTSSARQSARTFLVHFFGRELDAKRYVVERFHTTVDGEIKPYSPNGRSGSSRKQPRKVMSLQAVQRLRPERNEIIIASGVVLAGGVQYFGDCAAGFRLRGNWH